MILYFITESWIWHFLNGIALLILLSLLFSCNKTETSDIQTDICILSGSEAGFTAAIQAARMGNRVVLIEPTGHPGGMMVEGIAKDIRFGSVLVIGGIAREIYTAIESHYGRDIRVDDPSWFSRYEPHVAEEIIEEFLGRQKGIRVIRNTRIREEDGVKKNGTQIKSIVLENGMEVSAGVFVDASIEGDLIHFAGITTETIREGNEKYGETKNGIQTVNTYRQFEVKVDPYIISGEPDSGLIPTIQPGELGQQGAPSKYIQGYCYRLVLTRNPENRTMITRPENYDPGNYEIYRRYLKAGGHLFYPQATRPNGKTDLGSWHDLSANLYGENWKYPAGDYATKGRVLKYHEDFTRGLIWFLQHDPGVDNETRSNWENWGLCRDEFTDNGGWPRRLYIRSARRMVSDYVITEHHTRRDNKARVIDPVAIAWWPPDLHHARRIVKDGHAYNEGFIFGGNDWRPFGVSWKALIPKPTECENLITPTCPSSSYVAYGAIRILPTFMILGQSAGCMAVMALESNKPVQELDYSLLRERLKEEEQILEIPGNWLGMITTEN
jgi:hypothetical protein